MTDATAAVSTQDQEPAMTPSPPPELAPVEQHLDVPLSPADAFELFTARISEWWPRSTHAINAGRVADIVLECREGGRLYEVTHDGEECDWGAVTGWDPPRSATVAWFIGSPDRPTSWTVTFTERAEGGTGVHLVHSGWEHVEDGAQSRAGYLTGWGTVLGQCFGGAAAAAGS